MKFLFCFLLSVLVLTCTAQLAEFGDTNSASTGVTHLTKNNYHYLIGYEKHKDSTHTDIIIYKLTKDLEPVDTLAYRSPNSDIVHEAIWYNNFLVLAGRSVSLTTTKTKGLVLAMDTLGNIVQESIIEEPGANIAFNAITTGKNQLTVTGYRSSGAPADYFVMSFDSNYNEIWRYQGNLSNTSVGNSITYSPISESFTVATDLTTANQTIDIFVSSFSLSGQLLTETTWKDQLNGGCQKIIPVSTGGYLIVGESYTDNVPAFDVVVAKLDSNLRFNSYNLIPGTTLGEAAFDITELENNHYLLTGYAADTLNNNTGVLFLELDSGLNPIKNQIYRTSGSVSIGYTIKVDESTGKMIISGAANGSDFGYFIISDSMNLSNPPSLSTPKDMNEEQISIYPNPSKNKLCIDAENSYISRLTLYNQRGTAVFNTLITNKPCIAIDGLIKGIYFAVIETTDGIRTKKIVVQ